MDVVRNSDRNRTFPIHIDVHLYNVLALDKLLPEGLQVLHLLTLL